MPVAAEVNVADPPTVTDALVGCVVKDGATFVVPPVMVNVQVMLAFLPFPPVESHAVTVTVEAPAVVGVPAIVIKDELTGLPPVTLNPAGNVPVTLHDLGVLGAPVALMVTVMAVPAVPEMAKVLPALPLAGVAGVTPNEVAPATEL